MQRIKQFTARDKDILRAIEEWSSDTSDHEGTASSLLAQVLDLSESYVRTRLSALVRKGVLARDQNGVRYSGYALTDHGKDVVLALTYDDLTSRETWSEDGETVVEVVDDPFDPDSVLVFPFPPEGDFTLEVPQPDGANQVDMKGAGWIGFRCDRVSEDRVVRDVLESLKDA